MTILPMEYSYEGAPATAKVLLPPGFQGNIRSLPDAWLSAIPMIHAPRTILDLGVGHGALPCSLTKTYAAHSSSVIYCVDTWEGNKEFTSPHSSDYATFIGNLSRLAPVDIHKIHIHRGRSEEVVPRFNNEMFDIIFIDGNSETHGVLEDAMLSIRKLKVGGWFIVNHVESDKVRDGISMFILVYTPYFEPMISSHGQLFMRRNDRAL